MSSMAIFWGLKLTLDIISEPYLIRYYYIYFIIIFVALLIVFKREKLIFNNKHFQKRVESKIREITCILEKDKLVYKYDTTTKIIVPEDIYKVIEENDTVYIVSLNKTILLIIPNSAFKDISQKNEFVKKIREFNS
ncbi:YcxB family protein [Paraclostridium sordellii]|uniref:YcxB family protein n=2 Tax=Paraclostridium sordellii TaxID=1505 RepID=UPI0007092B00